MKVVIWLLDRFVPTLLMGASAALLAAGVLSYAPSAFGEWQTPAPTAGGDPRFESPSPAPSDQPTDIPTDAPPTGSVTQPPSSGSPEPTPGPTATPGPQTQGSPTRIVIPSLNIDLPIIPSDLVVPGNEGFYPLCDVAMYFVGFVEPGQPGTTYIYGHAQDGMFAPLLHASKYNNGASMIGALVEVYTSDNMLHMYEISIVKRHATDLSITQVAAGVHQLVIQTSEGWSGHIQKLQIAARPLAVLAASAREANPVPHPRVCLPD
jgi:hypothetical protein